MTATWIAGERVSTPIAIARGFSCKFKVSSFSFVV